MECYVICITCETRLSDEQNSRSVTNKSRKQQDTEQEPEPKKEERPRRDFMHVASL